MVKFLLASLPTEAQWEYACRAGTTTAYNNGWDGTTVANAPGWYAGNSEGRTHEVRQKAANNWGLYNMHGNVWEWCWDWISDNYDNSFQTRTNDQATGNENPAGASSGHHRVIRGGSWIYYDTTMRSAFRSTGNPHINDDPGVGFRLVRP